MAPGFGEPFDLFNASISLARGNYGAAALSASATIPFLGWGATGTKLGSKAFKGGDTTISLTVIGHIGTDPNYVDIAKNLNANYLKPSKDWNWQQQGKFIKEVINNNDNVLIGTPIREGPSVLKKEIKQLIKAGYAPTHQGSKLLIKKP